MNAWLVAAAVLALSLIPLQWVAFRRGPASALVALDQAGMVAVAALMALTVGFRRAPFMELPEVLTLVAFTGNLAFARMLERWV
ncbi:MAG: monovalent cation/H+ antiporter complex subunit F [Candidatus Dormibacterales bacterium]